MCWTQHVLDAAPRASIPPPVLLFVEAIKALTQEKYLALCGSAVTHVYMNSAHCSDYDLRFFNYDLEKLQYQLRSIRGFGNLNPQLIGISYRIIKLEILVGADRFDIEIATVKKGDARTYHKAMMQALADADFNVGGLYVPLWLDTDGSFEIRGLPECFKALDEKKYVSLITETRCLQKTL